MSVFEVIDGDTLSVTSADGSEQTIRIIGIDTPETVHPEKPVQCFGKEASDHLRALLEGQTVWLERKPDEDTDVFGRYLRYVASAERDIGAQMIEEGFAFSLRKYPHERMTRYNALEVSARLARRGLWSDRCTYASAAEVSHSIPASGPNGCTIKGNISTSGKLYHLPTCSSHARTVVDTSAGERWFCTETEAASAGWRKSGTCW